MNSTLQKNILFGYGLVLSLLIGVLIWALINQVEVWNTCKRLQRVTRQNVTVAENMIESMDRLNNASLLLAINNNSQLSDEITKSNSQFSEWMKLASENTSNQNENEIISNIENDYSSFQSSIAHMVNIDDESQHNRMAYYENNVFPSFIEVRDHCYQLRKINSVKLSVAVERAKTLSMKGIAFIVVFGISTIVIGILLWVFLAKLRL